MALLAWRSSGVGSKEQAEVIAVTKLHAARIFIVFLNGNTSLRIGLPVDKNFDLEISGEWSIM
jgi:hypothetical protein